MGTAPSALVVSALGLALAVVGARAAHADSCTGISSEGGRFAACFDPGNRVSVTGGNEGIGGGIAIRNTIDFEDEPDLVWKMSHDVLDITRSFDDSQVDGLLYRGVYLRHARDGHIVLPLGSTPKNIFLPFDIGALVEVGQLRWVHAGSSDLNVVRTAMLVDFARTRDFRTRFSVGPVASWDITFDDTKAIAVTDQRVAPFSSLLADVHLESHSGLTFGDLRVEGGYAWHTTTNWGSRVRAEADLERVLIAINDRPVALYANALYDSDTKEAIAGIGLRVVLVQRRDPRVSLNPPSVAMAAR